MGDAFVEVRCCCRPEKLLGWVPKPAMKGNVLCLPIMRPYVLPWAADRGPKVGVHVVELRLRTYVPALATGLSYPAFDSGDASVETLRLVRGFVENEAP